LLASPTFLEFTHKYTNHIKIKKQEIKTKKKKYCSHLKYLNHIFELMKHDNYKILKKEFFNFCNLKDWFKSFLIKTKVLSLKS